MKITPVKLLVALSLSLPLFSCHKDAVRGKVGFTTTDATGAESVGEQTVTISLGETVSTDTKIVFAVAGTASLDGNYSLETTSPITVKAGQSEFTFKFKVIDNKIIESGTSKYATFTITSVDNYTTKTTDNLVYTYTIKDNDAVPTSGLQADLTWDLGTGVSINNVVMGLYLVTDLVFDSNNAITGYTPNTDIYSDGKGFESYVLPTTLPDQDYYIVVAYDSGSVTVPYTLTLSDAADGSSHASDKFDATDSPSATGKEPGAFYGPFTKSGTSFTYTGSRIAATSRYPLSKAAVEKLKFLRKK